MLPGMDGLEVLRTLREEKVQSDVLLLTAKDTVQDRIRGLDSGADDYLVKPFDMDELLARTRALVRRRYERKTPIIEIGDLAVDTVARSARLSGALVELTAREYAPRVPGASQGPGRLALGDPGAPLRRRPLQRREQRHRRVRVLSPREARRPGPPEDPPHEARPGLHPRTRGMSSIRRRITVGTLIAVSGFLAINGVTLYLVVRDRLMGERDRGLTILAHPREPRPRASPPRARGRGRGRVAAMRWRESPSAPGSGTRDPKPGGDHHRAGDLGPAAADPGRLQHGPDLRRGRRSREHRLAHPSTREGGGHRSLDRRGRRDQSPQLETLARLCREGDVDVAVIGSEVLLREGPTRRGSDGCSWRRAG